MTQWLRARGGLPGEHLPPPGVCSNLTYQKNGKAKVRQTFDMPVDELGLPDADTMLDVLNATIDPEYEWPRLTNIHHLCYPRRAYHADPLMHELREGSAMLLHLPIQQHNLLHQTFEYMPMPSREVAQERVLEQRQCDTLFDIGRLAIRFERWSRQLTDSRAAIGRFAVRDALRLGQFYSLKAQIYSDRYSDYLERLPQAGGPTGLLPSRKDLMDMHQAVPELGQMSGQGFIDKRRSAEERKRTLQAA